VAVPFGSVGHGVQLEPQLAGLSLGTHLPPQSWDPGLQVSEHWPALHAA
jgi:hypothetical protein